MTFSMKELQDLGLDETQVKGAMILHGEDLNSLKDDLQQAKSERDSYKSQVDEVTKNLAEAKKTAEKGSEAQQQVETLQQQVKDSEKQAQEQLQAQQKDFSIDKALTGAGSKNNKAVLANIDTDKISLDENGHLIGLNDQIKALQDDESTNFLFAAGNQTPPAPKIFPYGNPAGGQGAGNPKDPDNPEDIVAANIAARLADVN